MPHLIFFGFFFFVGLTVNAQDTLYFRDYTKKIVLVLEASPNAVKYQDIETADGTIYYGSYKLIEKVVYLDGREYPLKRIDHYEYRKTFYEPLKYTNAVFFDCFPLVYQNVEIGYRHSFPKANFLTIGIPFSTSFSAFQSIARPYTNSMNNNIFSGGIEIMSYPNKFVFGIGSQFGQFRFDKSVLFENGSNQEVFKGIKNEYYIKLGYVANVNERFYLSLIGNWGFIQYHYHLVETSPSDPSITYEQTVVNDGFFGKLNIRFGYKF